MLPSFTLWKAKESVEQNLHHDQAHQENLLQHKILHSWFQVFDSEWLGASPQGTNGCSLLNANTGFQEDRSTKKGSYDRWVLCWLHITLNQSPKAFIKATTAKPLLLDNMHRPRGEVFGYMPKTVNTIRVAASRIIHVSGLSGPTRIDHKSFEDILTDVDEPLISS